MYCMNNEDEAAYEWSFSITEAMFHHFIAKNKYCFNIHTFIDQQINEQSLEDWKLSRHNHGHHDKADKSICIHLYPQDDTGNDSDISFSPAEEKSLEDDVVKKVFKRLTHTYLVPYYMASTMRKKDSCAPCSYHIVHPLVLPYAYQCSN